MSADRNASNVSIAANTKGLNEAKLNGVLQSTSFESEENEALTAFPPHSSDVFPQQQLQRDEPTFPMESPSFAGDSYYFQEHAKNSGNFSFSSHSKSFEDIPLSYVPLANDERRADAPYTSGVKDNDNRFPAPAFQSILPTDFPTVLEHPDSPSPSTSSSLSGVSLWSNLSRRGSSSPTKLSLTFKKKYGVKQKHHYENSGEEETISDKVERRYSSRKSTTSLEDDFMSPCSQASTYVNIGRSETMQTVNIDTNNNNSKNDLAKYLTKDDDVELELDPSTCPIEVEFPATIISPKMCEKQVSEESLHDEIEDLPKDCVAAHSPTNTPILHTVSPSYILKHGSGINYSPSCNSAAETEVRNNLSSKLIGIDSSCQFAMSDTNEPAPENNKMIDLNPKLSITQDRMRRNSNEETETRDEPFPRFDEVELVIPSVEESKSVMAKIQYNSFDKCDKQSSSSESICYSFFSCSHDEMDDHPLLAPDSIRSNDEFECNSELDENADCDLYFAGGSFDTVHGACTEIGFVEEQSEKKKGAENAVDLTPDEGLPPIDNSPQQAAQLRYDFRSEATPLLDTATEDSYSSSCSSSSSKSSVSTHSAPGILQPSRRGIGYNPFGLQSDFSKLVQRRRVQFSNIGELEKKNSLESAISNISVVKKKKALESVMKAQDSDNASISSDGSDSSLVYLMRYMGCRTPCEGDAQIIENDENYEPMRA